MIRYTFDKVSYPATKNLPCPGCGKRLRRSRTFSATENPWNRNLDGTARTRTEIVAALVEKARVWAREPEEHPACGGR